MLSAKWPGGPVRALLFLTAAAILGWSVVFRGTTPQDGPAGMAEVTGPIVAAKRTLIHDHIDHCLGAAGEAGQVLGTALAIKMFAYVTLSPVAQAFADRISRRNLLVGLNLIRIDDLHRSWPANREIARSV